MQRTKGINLNRDMDLVRKIVMAIADLPEGKALNGIDGVPAALFAAHVQWLEEAGLVSAAVMPRDSPRPAMHAIAWRLTWAGCDFADAVRSDTLWAKAKENVIKPSASWTFSILTGWLKAEISKQVGIPLA